VRSRAEDISGPHEALPLRGHAAPRARLSNFGARDIAHLSAGAKRDSPFFRTRRPAEPSPPFERVTSTAYAAVEIRHQIPRARVDVGIDIHAPELAESGIETP
jgi:hypothetical protein